MSLALVQPAEIEAMSPEQQLVVWRNTATYYQVLVERLFEDPEFYAEMRRQLSGIITTLQ